MAQLCGDESPEYWQRLEIPVIRQIKVREEASREETVAQVLRRVADVASLGHTPLLDKHEPRSLGGTGQTFDWTIARDVAPHHDFLLAGGLSPDNVGRAIAVVHPWGVDVSSGVETDGVKDSAKIAAFARQVRRCS